MDGDEGTQRPTFGVPVALARESYQARQKRLLAAGRHPLTGIDLGPTNETCGTCGHLLRFRYNQTFFKCALVKQTHGAATDVRVSWPACIRWKERSEDGDE